VPKADIDAIGMNPRMRAAKKFNPRHQTQKR